jgi:hypothetical protein
MKTWTIDRLGSIAWIAHPEERMQRASTAIVATDGCLVCDPVDAPGLDEALAPLGRVLGVCSLLDRHGRDSAAVAARHGAPVVAPDELPSIEAFAGIEPHPLYRARRWRETALWVPGRALLVVPESVGSIPFFLARPQDRLGMHPLVRLRPPRIQLARFDPTTVAVGHGEPVVGDAGVELARALSGSRRDIPRALATTARALVGRPS